MTRFKFVPYKLATGMSPVDDICWYCIDEMEAMDRGEEDWNSPLEECICAPGDDMNAEDWKTYQYDLIARSDIVHSLICNNNEKWLEDIRKDKMTVQCIFGKTEDTLTFRILCKDRFCGTTTNNDAPDHAESAWELLQGWGIFDLPSQDEMSLVVAFETGRKIKKGQYELTSSEVREVGREDRHGMTWARIGGSWNSFCRSQQLFETDGSFLSP
jgi:hypothetical protein